MRDTTQLHPELQVLMKKHIELCEKNGLKIKITECLRTVAEQDALYAQGRTKPGNIVTNAKGSTYSSFHMWGLAYDVIRNDGKPPYDNSDGFFDNVGRLGQQVGLTWGGGWRTIVDKPHFQLDKFGATSSALKQKYGTPDKFFATWKPVDPDDEYGEKLPEKKMIVIKDSYLRTSPEINKNKVPYSELSTSLKRKCRKDENGYAIINDGKTFTRIRSYVDKEQNKYMQMKSGYWIPVIWETTRRAKEA